ncbi:methyltransferase domain-containing protein [Colletotrichum higginsianum IMI 349063]|uniref:Methyltransferase domain-containing protein n=2 Tax=Colletotrichum higginsianum (strain IMI 349063) TaxID=759273 RepID=A0A1B7Y9E5_COLHI|nr:methyltransferase domain-containing protein [Colletotrichum higginsianum IMI 349063]OBR08468.1 methyltransferase domain-containing protein [Colletotrichum higginsianum IMI 349063]
MSQHPEPATALTKGFTNHLRAREQERRRKTWTKCPICGDELRAESRDDVQQHYKDNHAAGQDSNPPPTAQNLSDQIDEVWKSIRSRPPPPRADQPPSSDPIPSVTPSSVDPGPSTPTPEPERQRTLNQQSSSKTPYRNNKDERMVAPKRSRARESNHHTARSTDNEFRREPTQQKGKLWTPTDDNPLTRRADAKRPGDASDSPRAPASVRSFEPRSSEPDNTEVMIKEPETRPISQEQLVAEVKGIYAGLVMVESKCIEVDNSQSSNKETNPKLNNEQWQALIALHRTLLHEHHDFFLASQHPSASPALRRLASKYAMPARMWRHGIHSFLELLRHWLPASLEHMLAFIYLAYSMMALLYETVPTFEDTWIECLGDLGRYRMAIEDDDLKDREVWTSVSRHWYSKASDKAPTTGRLYHHLAILARPNGLQQLFYYSKSLCVPVPFLSARESIMTLFDPHLNGSPTRLQEIDAAFVRAHGILFSGKNMDQLAPSVSEFIDHLDNHIARNTKRWLDSGYYIGIALSCAILEYGSESNSVMRAIKTGRIEDADVHMDDNETGAASQKQLDALDFASRTHNVVFRRFGDPNVSPYVHVTLSFLHHLSHFPIAMGYIEEKIPWKLISYTLNSLMAKCPSVDKIESEEFPRQDKEAPRPLPEDFAQRGLLWVDKYYPDDWFTTAKFDDDEKYFEVASMAQERRERCLWLGCRLASSGNWLTYDRATREFGVPARFEMDVGEIVSQQSEGGEEDGDVIIPDAPAAVTTPT